MPRWKISYREKPIEYSMQVEASSFKTAFDEGSKSLDSKYEIVKIELEDR